MNVQNNGFINKSNLRIYIKLIKAKSFYGEDIEKYKNMNLEIFSKRNSILDALKKFRIQKSSFWTNFAMLLHDQTHCRLVEK